jgi:hypothetical protein
MKTLLVIAFGAVVYLSIVTTASGINAYLNAAKIQHFELLNK